MTLRNASLRAACVALLVASSAACEPERSIRERLTEAVALRENGDLERAEDRLLDLYGLAPNNPDVIGELVRVRLDDGRVDEAAALLLPALEATAEARPRSLLRAARRYYRIVARNALGAGTPFEPTDPTAFRDAALWLARTADDNQDVWQLDYLRFVVGRARALLGGNPTEPAELDELATHIAASGRLRALDAYLDELERPEVPEGEEAAALAAELAAIVAASERAAFNELFDRRFASQWRADLGRTGRYDAATDRIIIPLPPSVSVPATATDEQLGAIASRYAPRQLLAVAQELRSVTDIEVASSELNSAVSGATLVQRDGAWQIAAPVESLRAVAWAVDRVIEQARVAEASGGVQAP